MKRLYTIGYEGIPIREYIDILKQNKITCVCDVRNNPFSFKFGFSKKKFSEFLEKSNIHYHHLPNVGIHRLQRKKVGKNPGQRKKMFENYAKKILKTPEAEEDMDQILKLIKKEKGVVLTCYEKDYTDCHRSYLAKKLKRKSKTALEIIHLGGEE